MASGTVQINGQSIAVDVDADTLQDVMDRIAATSGVRTNLERDGDLQIRGLRTRGAAALVLGDENSDGLTAALRKAVDGALGAVDARLDRELGGSGTRLDFFA